MNRNIAEEGICAQVDPDLFFPETGQHDLTRAAKRICAGCPVRRACLAEALAEEGTARASHRHGVRGGCSPRERAAIAQQQLDATADETLAEVQAQQRPTAAEVLADRSVDLGGGHREWRRSSPISVEGGSYTPRQLAWYVAHGEKPVGRLAQLCEHKGCIAAEHLRDEGLPPTGCGTRNGYLAHRRAGEDACRECKDANASGDRRLQLTGSTKPHALAAA